MINYVWFLILAIGIISGLLTGGEEILTKTVVTSSEATVKLILGLCGILCLWSGIMKIAQESGLTDKIAKLLRPILKRIFKSASKDEKAMGDIVMNLTANMMGLSNAATPFGIKAMEDMERLNKKKGVASNDMALFLVLNAACIQFVPTTILSVRAVCGSQNPGEIIIPAIITTGTSALFGVIFCKILQKYF